MLDHELPIPLYAQLQELLRDKLENGSWESGDRLPTEEELCSEYKVSRTTVRSALRGLEIEGIIERSPKVGTTIARPRTPEHILQSVIGSYALVYPEGGRLSTKVLGSEIVVPSKLVRTELQLPKNEKAIRIERVRFVDGEPLFWTTAFVPHALCPNFKNEDFQNHSFFELFERKYGIFISHAKRSVIATIASSNAITHLGVKPGAPVARVIVHSYISNGDLVEFSDTFFRGDRVRFEVDISRNQDPMQTD